MKFLVMANDYEGVYCAGVFDTKQQAEKYINDWDSDLYENKSGAWVVEARYNPVYE